MTEQGPEPDNPYAGRQWAEDAPDKPEHPEPEITARAAREGEVPRGPQNMIKRCGVGWETSSTFSRGHKPLARTPWVGDVCDVVLVRFRHRAANVRAVGIWVAGRFHDAFVWRLCAEPDHAGLPPHPSDVPVQISAADLSVIISDEPQMTAERIDWAPRKDT